MNATDACEGLIRALRRNRLAHAYIFNGAPHGAAGTLAVRFLQFLACETPDAPDRPCGHCRACRHVRDRIWPDFHWIEPALKSRQISIEQIRILRGSLSQSALNGGWKAGLILHADRLTEQAANAFLKTLEEPAPDTLLLLLTDAPPSLPPTLISRCQRIDVAEPENLPFEAPWADACLAFLDIPPKAGPIEKMAVAERVLETLGDFRGQALAGVRAESRDDNTESPDDTLNARAIGRYREGRAELVRLLQRAYLDVVRLKAGGNTDPRLPQAHRQRLRDKAETLTLAQALANTEVVEQLYRRLERNLSESSVLAAEADRLQ